MAAKDPADRILIARIAASARWGRETDPVQATQKARDAFLRRFLDLVPESVVDPEARMRMAEHLRREYMGRLARRSAEVRKKK